MSKVKDLVKAYEEFISIPWQEEIAAEQRVIFCVYDEHDELKIRAIETEFELATIHSGHQWIKYDFTDVFPLWMISQPYAEKCFVKPELFNSMLGGFMKNAVKGFGDFLEKNQVQEKQVVALTGIGSLFGLLKVRDLIVQIAKMVPGRLVVFFPGAYEKSNYRLLDAYDGWNYLAVPITADHKE